MKVRDLLRRTSVRLAGTFTVLFTATFLALFLVLVLGIEARQESDIRHHVEETVDALAALGNEPTLDDLVGVVDKESSSVRDSDFIFELTDDAGAFLAGNVRGTERRPGWLRLRRSDVFLTLGKGDPDDEFLAVWKDVPKGHLLVGSSNREVRQMRIYLMQVLAYGSLATLAIIGAASLYLARNAQSRIQGFARALGAVSQGAIGARVPISGSGDDIDLVAAQVNRALAQLQTLIDNVNQSSSDIAHDLKKPIGRIRQQLEEAGRSSSSAAEMRTAIGSAILDLDSITETFDALLRITQIEAGGRRSRFCDVDLCDVLLSVTDVYAPVAEDAGHELCVLQCLSGSSVVRGDEELLVQLFSNLIENAICHCHSPARIVVDTAADDKHITVRVSDTGPGIPPEEREKVLRRLYRMERARSTPGNGLGLSLAAAIAAMHDATITLSDNEPGLRVEVRFPRA